MDLGRQPACDYFPLCSDPGPDPAYPLQMWLCADCGLAQLASDPTAPEEPRGAEPAALRAQAKDAVRQVAEAGWLKRGLQVAEYGSPHGGSWLSLLSERGLIPVGDGMAADLIVDCFGFMHAADQDAALRERIDRLAPGGTILLQYHSLNTIVRSGQWNALRHGHYAYYSTSALTTMLECRGLRALEAWQFDLYGGTVLLAATRKGECQGGRDSSVDDLLAEELRAGIPNPYKVSQLQRRARDHADALHGWLLAAKRAGTRVVGYGAASRAVALLVLAGADKSLIPAIADAAPAKRGRRMPGTDIPIVSPATLLADPPDAVLLFVPDLISEVRAALPEVEAAGGVWVEADALEALAQC